MSWKLGGLLCCLILLSGWGGASSIGTRASGSSEILQWVPNGPVADVASIGSRLLIGGQFTRIGPRTGPAAVLSPESGRTIPGFPEFAGGPVEAIVSDGTGGWFVGGSFRWAGGQPCSGLAHVLADGTVDVRFSPAFVSSPGSPDDVHALAVGNGVLYVGGDFVEVDGHSRAGLAAFEVGSGSLTDWAPELDEPYVRVVAADGTSVFVAGAFSHVGGALRTGLAAIDAGTGEPTAWDPALEGSVSAIAVADGLVYLGGSFSHVGGAVRTNLAAVDEASGNATSWAPSAPAPVSALTLDRSSLFAGLRSRQAATSPGLIAFARSTSAAQLWSAESNGSVVALSLEDQTVYAGGAFRTIDGMPRTGLAALNAASGSLQSWHPAIDLFADELAPESAVHTVAVGSVGVLVGGDFASVGGVARHGLAAVDGSTGAPAAWDPRLDGPVSGLAKLGSRFYVVGRFKHVGGKRRNGAAALSRRLKVLPWAPPALEPPGLASNVTIVDGKIVLTGHFNGVAAHRGHGSLAAFDASRGRLLDWGPPKLVGNGVTQVLEGGGHVYAVGISGETSTVAELNARTGRVKRFLFNNRATGDVYAIALRGKTLYVGGAVQRINGEPRERLAAVDTTTGRLLPWHPAVDENTFSMEVVGSTLYIGGQFQHVDGQSRVGLAALDLGTGDVLPWDPQLSGFVSRVGLYRGGIYAAGRFLSVGPYAQPFLGLFP